HNHISSIEVNIMTSTQCDKMLSETRKILDNMQVYIKSEKSSHHSRQHKEERTRRREYSSRGNKYHDRSERNEYSSINEWGERAAKYLKNNVNVQEEDSSVESNIRTSKQELHTDSQHKIEDSNLSIKKELLLRKQILKDIKLFEEKIRKSNHEKATM
ncbi:hypothetical protein L9F63_011556, partial [Diploptera punctata]